MTLPGFASSAVVYRHSAAVRPHVGHREDVLVLCTAGVRRCLPC